MFTEAEKRVFKYHDGQAEAFADPLAARRSFVVETQGRFNDLLTAYYGDDELASCEAAVVLVPVVRQVFSMNPFDRDTGKGATEDDVDRVLTEFLDWCDEQKKSTVTTPTSSSPATSTPAA